MKWTFWHSASLCLLTGVIILAGILLPLRSGVWTWTVLSLTLIISAMVIGHGVTGLWKGILIDEDNRVSLSRLQMVCWTIVVLSAFLTAAFLNIRYRQGDPLAIKVPESLWILLGISTTSLVGSPLVLSTKKDKPFSAGEFLRTNTFSIYRQRGFDENRIGNIGFIVIKKRPQDATLADVFRGEEVSNDQNIDLSKVQMFYFTVIILVAYVVDIIKLFSKTLGGIPGLPPLPESLIALLGISHAGFLASKAVPRPVTKTDGGKILATRKP